MKEIKKSQGGRGDGKREKEGTNGGIGDERTIGLWRHEREVQVNVVFVFFQF